MDFNQTYLVSYQNRYLEIDAETTHDAKEIAMIRFNAKSINDVEIYLTNVEYDPYYF